MGTWYLVELEVLLYCHEQGKEELFYSNKINAPGMPKCSWHMTHATFVGIVDT